MSLPRKRFTCRWYEDTQLAPRIGKGAAAFTNIHQYIKQILMSKVKDFSPFVESGICLHLKEAKVLLSAGSR